METFDYVETFSNYDALKNCAPLPHHIYINKNRNDITTYVPKGNIPDNVNFNIHPTLLATGTPKYIIHIPLLQA